MPETTQTDADRGAYATGVYPNLFVELLGVSADETDRKIEAAWQQLFYGGDEDERVYYPVGEDMAYVMDINNNDIRSEGISYGLMIAVQLDKKAEFDRIWTWTKTYMQQSSGPFQGYFAWHLRDDGSKMSENPASDGEVWIVTSLFFAAARWGNGDGIYNYEAEANAILGDMLHRDAYPKGERLASTMFHPETKQVVFVPMQRADTFTDPSYHLPHYVELWARWASDDNAFWCDAVRESRALLRRAVHPVTGLAPDYTEFDGTPRDGWREGDHSNFRYDAWRVAMNVAIDNLWFGGDGWAVEQSNRLLGFFHAEGLDAYVDQYTLDGEKLDDEQSTGLVAANAVAALAADLPVRKDFVEALWNAEIPSGNYRYYDGLLYLFGLLQLSGEFQVHHLAPPSPLPCP